MNQQEFCVNLCTFLGREHNVCILKLYVHEALKIGAIDHYWMFDLTRNVADHEYVYDVYCQLERQYPGRVHLINHEERKKELNEGIINISTGRWGVFYKYLNNFNDNDVIIKCDDDTLYFDVETIRDAAKIRWENKSPMIMHANTINNGVCAYHQQEHGKWRFEGADVLNMYPTCGLTGPLFSHPTVAGDCHKQFVNDMLLSEQNIETYKLNKNIYFCSRVSINMMFILGEDRHLFTHIDSQDEYITSSKLGQQHDRPNMIIGDFVTAHHTYGTQESIMGQLGTYEMYYKLAETIFSSNPVHVNKTINCEYGTPVKFKHNDVYLSRYWSTRNSVTIKNVRTEKYINVDWFPEERVDLTRDVTKNKSNKHGRGVYRYKTDLISSEQPVIVNLDLTKPSVMQIQDCSKIIKCYHPDNNGRAKRFIALPVQMWYNKNYTVQHVRVVNNQNGTYKIESDQHPRYYLVESMTLNGTPKYIFEYESEEEWFIDTLEHTNDMLVPVKFDRGDQDMCENDPTTARVTNSTELPSSRNCREFYWMVDNYIWEFVDTKQNSVFVRLIGDGHSEKYLSVKNNGLCLSEPDHWTVQGHSLMHCGTRQFLNVYSTGVGVSDKPQAVIQM